MPRKARGTPPPIQPTEASGEFAYAFVRPVDTTGARFTIAARADLLLPKISQWVEIAAHDNAQACASNILRLYRKKGTKRAGKNYRTRKVTNEKRLDWLHGNGIDTPGQKAVLWASQGEDVEEVIDGDIVAFLRQPNPFMSGADWTYLRFKSCESVGNAYTWFYTDGDKPEAYFLPPQGVRLVASSDMPIAYYRYSRMGDKFLDIEAQYVLHQRLRPSEQDNRIGESWTHAIVQAMDAMQAGTDSRIASWRNMSRPDYLLVLPENTSPAKQKEIKDKVKNEYRGPQKAGNFMVATAGTDIKPLGFSPKDQGFTEEMHYWRLMVDNAAGRPESRSKMNDANRASADAGAVQYARTTLLPRLIRDAESLTEFLLPVFNLTPGEYWFSYDNPVPEDTEGRTNRVTKLVAGGIMTVNEARVAEQLDTVSDPVGDELRYNGQPMTSKEETAAREEANRQAQTDTVAGQQQDQDEAAREQQAKRIKAAVHKALHKGSCGCEVKEYEGEDDPAYADVYAGLERDVAAWIKSSAENATIADDGTVTVDDQPLAEALEKYILTAVGISLMGVIFSGANAYAKKDADACAKDIDDAVARYRQSPKTDADKGTMRIAIAKALRANVENGNVGNVIAKLDGDAKELAVNVAADVYGWAESGGQGSGGEVVQASYSKLLPLAAVAALVAQQARRARGLGGAASRYARRVAQGMANTQRLLVTAAAVAAQANGVPLEASLMSARSSVAETASYRSVTTGRTEVAASANYANIWAYSAGGRVEAVEWVLSAVPCQACIELAINTAQRNGSMDPVAAAGFRAQLAAIGPGYNDNTKPQLAALGNAVAASGASFAVPLGQAFGAVGARFDNIEIDEDNAMRHMAWLAAAGQADGRGAGTFEMGMHAPPLHPNCNCSITPVFRV